MHILLLQQPSALGTSQALSPSHQHTHPSSVQPLLANKEPEHIKTTRIRNGTVILGFKITVTQTGLAFLLREERFYTAQLL